VEECQRRSRREELQKTEKLFEKSHRKDQQKYLEIISDENVEFQRKGSYDLMYMKTKEVG
jgi:hypothetical protein